MLITIVILVMGLLVLAAGFDIRARKIPNWIPLSVFFLFLAFLAGQFFIEGSPELLPPLGSIATGLGTLVIFATLFYFGLIGGGDVKLITAVAFWAGTAQIAAFLVIMGITGGVLAFFYILKGRTGPKDEKDLDENFGMMEEKTNKNEVKGSKTMNKRGSIPYGLAISVAGLFVVNQILTILIA